MILSRLQSRGRITVPPEVCAALGLQAGDTLAYEITGDQVIVSKGNGSDADGSTEDDDLRPLIDGALADRRPSLPLDEAFAEVRARIAARDGRKDAA